MTQANTLNIISSWRQKKDVEVGGGQLREVTRKNRVNKVWLLCRFKSVISPLVRVSRDLVILLFLEGDTFTNGDFFYKCKYLLQKGHFSPFSLWQSFLSFSCVCCFLKIIITLKITLMPKRHILGWQILLSFPPSLPFFLFSFLPFCCACIFLVEDWFM